MESKDTGYWEAEALKFKERAEWIAAALVVAIAIVIVLARVIDVNTQRFAAAAGQRGYSYARDIGADRWELVPVEAWYQESDAAHD